MKKLSPEKLSRYIFYALVSVIAVVFVAFFAAGSEPVSYSEDEQYAPVLVDFIIYFLFAMIVIAAFTAIFMLLRTLFIRGNK